MATYAKEIVIADPFPFRVGNVRLAYPGTLDGKHTVHDPRPEFKCAVWSEEEAE